MLHKKDQWSLRRSFAAIEEAKPEGLVPVDVTSLSRMDLVWVHVLSSGQYIPMWVSTPEDRELFDPTQQSFLKGNWPNLVPMIGKFKKVWMGEQPIGTEFWKGPRSVTEQPVFDGPFVIRESGMVDGIFSVQYSFPEGESVEVLPIDELDYCYVKKDHTVTSKKEALEKYVEEGGFWATCNDPILDTVSKASHGKHKVVIVKLKGNVATVKVIKGKVPWLVDVPKDTLDPHYNRIDVPEWGERYLDRHHFSPGDVVFHTVSKKPYVVDKSKYSNRGFVPLISVDGTKHVTLPVKELEFGGRLNQAGKVVSVSPLSSSRLKAAPAPARKPEPPSQEV